MKTLISLCIAHLLVLTMASSRAYSQSPSNTQANLGGVVVDINQARIVNAKVILESGGQTTTVATKDDGSFEVRLLPGVYKAKVVATGFCPLTRANFELRSSDNVTLNFVLSDCALEHALTFEKDRFKEESARYKLPFKEESIDLLSALSLKLVVHFGKRSEKDGIIEYRGFELSNARPVGVTATYNHITLQADIIRFERNSLRMEAHGNVLVEDGKQKLRGNSAIVKLTNEHPQIDVRP